jgi:hypothetical protein
VRTKKQRDRVAAALFPYQAEEHLERVPDFSELFSLLNNAAQTAKILRRPLKRCLGPTSVTVFCGCINYEFEDSSTEN